MSSAARYNETQVTVGRWSATYEVSRDLPSPHELQQRLDSIVAHRLALACKASLEQSINHTDPSVWRVRDLALNFSLETSLSDIDRVAGDWGRSLAFEILSIIEDGEVSDSILRFPNRAAFFAQFLADLAAGRAWGKWYYEEFSDLQALPCRQIICSIFLRKDPLPADLLLQLDSKGRLETVLEVLNESDADLIFDLCFENAAPTSRVENLQKWAGIVLELWNSGPLRAVSRVEVHSRDALRLLIRTISHHPTGLNNLDLKRVINVLLAIRSVLLGMKKPSLMDSLFNHLAIFDLRSAVDTAVAAGVRDPGEALFQFAEIMQGDIDWARQAAAVVLGESNKEKFLTYKNIPESDSVLSRFGGIFLLGPSLIGAALEETTRLASDTSESPEKYMAVLRHLAAVMCFGCTRFPDTSDDPALRLFSGMEGIAFRQAVNGLGSLDLAGAHAALLRTILDRHESHAPILFADVISSSPEKSVLLLRELVRDEWLDAISLSDVREDPSERLRFSLQRFSAILASDQSILILSDSLSSRIEISSLRQVPYVSVLNRRNGLTTEKLAMELGLSVPQLAFRLDSAQQHFAYFSLAENSSDFHPNAELDCFFTLVARSALRLFSRRLFGFQSSSPEHIFQNFLSGVSEISLVGDHLEVQLPQSPLSMILRMAGLQDQKYAPSWLKGMEVWLLPPQE